MSFYFTLPHPSPPQDIVFVRTACPWEHERKNGIPHPNPRAPGPRSQQQPQLQEPCILDEVITAIPDITAYVLETVGADIRSDKVALVEGAEDSMGGCFKWGWDDAVGWAESYEMFMHFQVIYIYIYTFIYRYIDITLFKKYK